jgi:hypothetical protein
METQKISDSAIKEIIPQPSIEIIHEYGDIKKKIEEAEEKIIFAISYRDDLLAILKKLNDAGCKLSEEAPIEEIKP